MSAVGRECFESRFSIKVEMHSEIGDERKRCEGFS
jgi:hypothetical protein